jgi:hypothetical protein
VSRQTVPNYELASDAARLNLLTNGGFETWQRGNGPFTATAMFTADRWRIDYTGSMSVSRDTTNIDPAGGGQYAAAVAYTHTGTESTIWQPRDFDNAGLKGRTVTASVRVRTSVANAVRLAIYDGSFNYSAYHPGDGTWQTLTVTRPAPGGAQSPDVRILFNASCTAYVDNAMLVIGSVAADYTPLHPADDLARCLRYYEFLADAGSGTLFVAGNAPAGAYAYETIVLRAKKPVTPTLTAVGTWNYSNASGVVATTVDTASVGLRAQITAAGYGFAFNTGGGATFVAEANP